MDGDFDLLRIFQEDDVEDLEEYCYYIDSVDENFPKPDFIMNLELFINKPSLLCAACYFKSYKCVTFLMIQDADIYFEDKKMRTPFLFAIAGGSLPILQLLVEKGANTEDADIEGNGAVHYAVKYNQRAIILWLCYGLGLSISEKNKKAETPLHTAATEMKTDIIQLLCSHGADINARTKSFGATPLHYAALKNNVKSIEIFYDNGADLSVKDNGVL